MTDVTIKDRIVAHRSAPDVYDPPTFEQMADRIEELEAKLAKATGAVERIVGGEIDGVLLLSNPPRGAAKSYAASILAELKGDKE